MFESKYDATVNYVKEHTNDFDESHDYEHAKNVYNFAKQIMDSCKIEYDLDILMFAALLHDVRDKKYANSITLQQLEDYISSFVPHQTTIIIKIIENISYSREVSGKREKLEYPYNIYLDAISDADRIEALGKRGIHRCEIFTKTKGGKVPEDVIVHCHEKLLRLYPEQYIRTEMGRILAKPLHQEIVDYVEFNKT